MVFNRDTVRERPRGMGGEMLNLRLTWSPVSVVRRSLGSKIVFLTADHEIDK